MHPNLFTRVFTYPASQFVSPNENLATEVIAYFLESWPKFRQKFLSGIGVETDAPKWSIETQRRLYAPDKEDWHGKIPDLQIRSADGKVLVAVEVKIDAGVTYSGEEPQTKFYREYLQHEKQEHHLEQVKLVLLTRWTPGSLMVDEAFPIRFTDIANWLSECIDPANVDDRGQIDRLAGEWVHFLYERRWAMKEITKSHLEAIKPMGELLLRLQDELWAVREAVLSNPIGTWTSCSSRSATNPWRSGLILWERAVAHKADAKALVQFGFFYGDLNGQPALRPVLWFNQNLVYEQTPTDQAAVEAYDYNSFIVQCDDMAAAISGGPSRSSWDAANSQLTAALGKLRLAPPATSKAATTAAPPSEMG